MYMPEMTGLDFLRVVRQEQPNVVGIVLTGYEDDTGDGAAHGIFAWDRKAHVYRYWWFEDSGEFSEAAGDFINDETLFLKWHDTSLIQTFKKIDSDKLILKMDHKPTKGKYESILEVVFTRKRRSQTELF